MSKVTIAILATITIVFFLAISIVILSFTFFKKNSDELIRSQRDKLLTIVNVPNAVPPSNPTFDSITYTWEMETTQKEVATVNVLQTTGLNRSENKILVVLEKAPAGDPSVFDKVLPAVIADSEVLEAAFSREKLTSLESGQTGFNRVAIERDASGDKVIKITWEFDKEEFGTESRAIYDKLQSLPPAVVTTLYAVQSIVIAAFSGQ